MSPHLIVMLTYDDLTAPNAAEIFQQCKDSPAHYWGFKEQPLPLDEMRALYRQMKDCGKTTCLEVVAYTEEEGMEAAHMAVECQCDILMGTTFTDNINAYCQEHGIKYMPFVGLVSGRPSTLDGDIRAMVGEAQHYIECGAYGIDLLAYRYTGDTEALIHSLCSQVDAPVCVAGSIDSYEKLDIIDTAGAWAFTIGGAFFNQRFGNTFPEQIDNVFRYLQRKEETCCDTKVTEDETERNILTVEICDSSRERHANKDTSPSSHSNDSVVDYYDTIADQYDDSRFGNSYGHFIDYEERRILDQLIDTAHGTQRLEMACGTGRLTNYATHALDASNEMMKHARRRHQNVDFRQASATDTGFDDNMFDTVYAFHLMMHLDTNVISDIINEAYRILKPGGCLIFDIPSQQRRRLLRHKQSSWHGATTLKVKDVKTMTAGRFSLSSTHGIMLLPVHKLPTSLRKPLRRTDYTLANSFLKPYSSYIVLKLVKKN